MRIVYLSLLALLLGTAGHSNYAVSQDSMTLANAVVTAADRSPEDRALDAGRKPAELLAFLGIRPGVTSACRGQQRRRLRTELKIIA
jgi:predicted methyltransferase